MRDTFYFPPQDHLPVNGKSLSSQNTGRGLVMAMLNINSLTAHIDDLRLFMRNSKIDILAINETKLDNLVLNREISLAGFEPVREDRDVNGSYGGGVCIYLRNNLNFKPRKDLTNNKLECLFVEIHYPRSKPFLIGTWYRPPSSPAEVYIAFEKLIDKIDAEDKELYLLGDLNSDLLPSNAPNHNSKKLLNILDVYELSQLINEATHITLTK